MDPIAAISPRITPLAQGADPNSWGVSGLGKDGVIQMPELPGAGTLGASSGEGSFAHLLEKVVTDVGAKQAAANEAVTGLLSGGNVPLHQAMISMEEASVSFQLMVEVRNKLLESYQEIMRLQM